MSRLGGIAVTATSLYMTAVQQDVDGVFSIVLLELSIEEEDDDDDEDDDDAGSEETRAGRSKQDRKLQKKQNQSSTFPAMRKQPGHQEIWL